MTMAYAVSPKLSLGMKKFVGTLRVPRADVSGLRWEMFWPCVSVLAMCAAPLGWALGPLIFGVPS